MPGPSVVSRTAPLSVLFSIRNHSHGLGSSKISRLNISKMEYRPGVRTCAPPATRRLPSATASSNERGGCTARANPTMKLRTVARST
eukprot:scaffold34_cov260-Pinguiococcus_pyrenoidosus.AAC.8